MDLLYKQECFDIIGACMEVHRTLGSGFLEAVYQDALAIEFENANVPFEKEKKIEIIYKGAKINSYYFADFICYGNIIVELKAVSELNNRNKAQLFNYLNATGKRLGILVNFGAQSLTYKRIIL